jgi:hypothetical protein
MGGRLELDTRDGATTFRLVLPAGTLEFSRENEPVAVG